MEKLLPGKTIERLSLYRRSLLGNPDYKDGFIFSHEMAKLLHLTPVQIRRDLMLMGYSGSPSKGYDIDKLIHAISKLIDPPETRYAAVVGMGNLGNAIAKYLGNKREFLKIIASFDNDENKVSKCATGIKCYHIDQLEEVITDFGITIAIITVPKEVAKATKDKLVECGIKGIMNFTSTPLNVPKDVVLEEFDMITSLEKVVYYVKNT